MQYIRTDMNETIATGHMMRCLSVADALRELGEDTTFILADAQAAELLKARGYAYIILYTRWDEPEAELPALKQLVAEQKIERLLIDSYQVTYRYLSELNACTSVIYLDDLNAFCYPVDVLICYANYWEKFHYTEHYPNAKLYLGTEYVPLRKAFWNCGKKEIPTQAKRLLLLSGGSDPYDVMGRVLKVIDRQQYQQIDVICGAYNTRYEALCEAYRQEDNVCIHRAVSDMERYMKEADLAVSAGGTTLYELCACGTPTISYAFADNQLDNVMQFQADGIMDYAGDARCDDIASAIRDRLEQMRNNQKMRQERSLRMQELVDGKGALRLAKALLK